ncbi:MAG: ParB/RepB/Spo0J family partition protein [Gemmatimonadetes bacterium]|nr:MAG: ParB/RepB/Spo0J family partition protein [Gemmatimonadota bacterium]
MAGGRKDRLGKGLGALLGEYVQAPEAKTGEVVHLPLKAIVPNPAQPRRTFAAEELAELAASIRENGLLQPLLVRPVAAAPGRYELVAGERRLRAVTSLGWDEVPAMVREVPDDVLLVLALVENLQREQLSPLEEAEGYRVLQEEHGLTQEDIARSVGKDRSTVANMLRLLKLPPSVRRMLDSGDLSTGHARALLALDDGVRAGELARAAVREGLSVREVERRVKAILGRGREAGRKKSRAEDPVVAALQEELRAALGSRVALRQKRDGTGVIEVPFSSHEDFERVFQAITGRDVTDVVG